MSNLPNDRLYVDHSILENKIQQMLSIHNIEKEVLWELHVKIFNTYMELCRSESNSSTLMAEIDRIFIAKLCGKEKEIEF